MKRVNWALVLFVFLACSGIAFAVQAPGAPAAPAAAAAPATSTATAILLAAANGALIGVVGWLSQRKQEDGSHEPFDPVQLVTTILVGALIGAIAAWRKKSFGDVETWVENSGYVAVAEMLLKAVWRNFSVKLSSVLGSLKAGGTATNPTTPAPAPADPPKP